MQIRKSVVDAAQGTSRSLERLAGRLTRLLGAVLAVFSVAMAAMGVVSRWLGRVGRDPAKKGARHA